MQHPTHGVAQTAWVHVLRLIRHICLLVFSVYYFCSIFYTAKRWKGKHSTAQQSNCQCP